MENFVLYEEVGRGDHTIVYKGRRKGTIHFVAIHCIDKCKRPHITNLVRLTHEINHENVMKFHEWYETSNHLWLVVELCTGGSLETVIAQDDHLPESSIKKFGVDLVQGLHHVHSLGIIFSDLKPSKILLDGPGVLKFADFGLSRVEGENLQELFEQFAEAGEMWNSADPNAEDSQSSDVPKKFKTLGSPTYLAPEVLTEGAHGMTSDLWALGCVLYEMYTGHPPFLADNFQQLKDKILHKQLTTPRVKGSRVSGKPSQEFQSLLDGLLRKNPQERLGWAGLVTHPFWDGGLQHLTQDLETDSEIRQSVRQSIANFSTRASTTSELPKGNSVLGHVKGVDLPDGVTPEMQDDVMSGRTSIMTTDRPDSVLSMRPRTAPGTADGNVSFTISSRPHTAATPDPVIDEHLSATSPHKNLLTQSPLNVKEVIRRGRMGEGNEDKTEVSQLIYHTSDFTITSIVDNPKIQKPTTSKYEPKTLQVPPYSADKIQTLQAKEQEKHIKLLIDSINGPEKGPLSQKRVHLLHYASAIAVSTHVADLIVRMGGLNVLARQIKEAQQLELRAKLLRLLGIVAYNTSEVEESTNLSEVMTILTEILRDSFRNIKVKVAVLPTVGEILYLVARQEEIKGRSVELWSVSSMTYTLIIRCLREGEEAVINHYAAKIIENVATTSTLHVQKFTVSEVGLLLWYVFTHATADALRATSLSALSRISKHSIGVFQGVVEKVGLPKMLNTMVLPINRIQQAMVTMFASLIISDSRLTRLIQDKEFCHKLMRLLESPSVVIRGKAFLVLLEIMKNNQETLVMCCQNRLIMYIERDSRRQAPGKADNQSQMEYLSRCLDLLITSLADMVPHLTKEILGSLDAVSGRKHPSTVQVKQLKVKLPMMPVIQHLLTSQIFRPKIVNESFLKSLSLFLIHVKSIDSGSMQIQSATGSSGTEEFTHTVFALVETLAQHPSILTEHHTLIIDKILPALAALVSSSSGDTRALSLRMFSELAATFLNQEMFDTIQHKQETKKLHQIIAEILLPQYEQILLEPDPLPSYGLKLLLALLEQNPSFIRDFEKLNLVPVLFQVLADHHNNPVSTTMQNLAGILACLITHKETNMNDLYEQALVEHLTGLIIEVSAIGMNSVDNTDLKAPTTMLVTLLDGLHGILKYVSEVVRKALQAKKAGGDGGSKEAEMAEGLLLSNKHFTDLTSLLTQMLTHDDTDIADVSLKCLSLLVQLFGGEHPEALAPDNMDHYSAALKNSDAKKQKIILRIIKRMISTERSHADTMRHQGAALAATIESLIHSASSHAEVALSTLAVDILKATGYK